MQDKDLVSVMTVEDTARRFHYLTVTGAFKFLGVTATVRVVGKLLDMVEDALDKICGGDWVFQCDVVSNCIQIRQCRF